MPGSTWIRRVQYMLICMHGMDGWIGHKVLVADPAKAAAALL
jgi:hypothetical protein